MLLITYLKDGLKIQLTFLASKRGFCITLSDHQDLTEIEQKKIIIIYTDNLSDT